MTTEENRQLHMLFLKEPALWLIEIYFNQSINQETSKPMYLLIVKL